MKHTWLLFTFILILSNSVTLSAKPQIGLTVEELRVEKAQQAMPILKDYFDWSTFKSQWLKLDDFVVAKRAINQLGDELWQFSKRQAQSAMIVDDRPLTSGKAKDITANSLTELAGQISVQGGGGDYLSNEISYRSIALRNKLGSTIPTGHIHTPRISDFDDETNQKITAQIKAMLIVALAEI